MYTEVGKSSCPTTEVPVLLGEGLHSSNNRWRIQFTIDEDTPYALSGFYNLAGLDAVQLECKLTDTTASQVLFNNKQRSNNTPNQHFTLGELEGDYAPTTYLSGDLTGMLTGGHTYKLAYHFFIMHRGSNQSAGADGQIRLQIGSAIPEPSTLASVGGLLVTGLIGGWWSRRRSRFVPRD